MELDGIPALRLTPRRPAGPAAARVPVTPTASSASSDDFAFAAPASPASTAQGQRQQQQQQQQQQRLDADRFIPLRDGDWDFALTGSSPAELKPKNTLSLLLQTELLGGIVYPPESGDDSTTMPPNNKAAVVTPVTLPMTQIMPQVPPTLLNFGSPSRSDSFSSAGGSNHGSPSSSSSSSASYGRNSASSAAFVSPTRRSISMDETTRRFVRQPSNLSNSSGDAASSPLESPSFPRKLSSDYYSPTAPVPLGTRSDESLQTSPFSTSAISALSERILTSPKPVLRKISRHAARILDAPDLQDDFYLNLLDWSSLNMVSVALGSSVFLWGANTAKVTKLCDLSEGLAVTSLSFVQRGTHLGVGTTAGTVQLWDVEKNKKVQTLNGHTGRVGALAWNGSLVASGSRDRSIHIYDVRMHRPLVRELQAHKQEVCGLKWSPDGTMLASGGNDNKLHIWKLDQMREPILRFSEHAAAVKAIAWSPHQHGLLASGGGTADKTIRFWNTTLGACLTHIETGSQVCNLAWSKSSPELVSTHGYSQNQIVVWRYPQLSQLAILTGHTMRVLYLALSPDGETVVTGAGDETLRFWHVFSQPGNSRQQTSALQSVARIR
ncbi:Fzr1 protein [Capsaspora owczarzaki ATCC 30864]|uniref:Fzr1 protein n=1 Tax=Capsaspora owczarzaki (strain ATCC 30864) TaxID=595528 RepID=A0A0D2WGF9_CAPO3|nr:Fzr1 protein [Capsaspora owczarzaki ATCC 30864]KJE88495.1 Fzr1 protein [Capsaspora owczarzaki ATCC 30864]|eukprot:XP_004365016.2 Fzr1 protein [Capsaspora owczarzaki ATCC 30864]